MKTIYTTVFVLLCFFTSFEAISQEKGEVRASAGFSGMHLDNSLGLAVGGEYFFGSRLSVAASWVYSERNGDYVTFESLLSADVRYYLVKKKINFYLYSGYGIHQFQWNDFNDFGIRNFHSTTFGAGVDYAMTDKLGVYAQGKGWYNGDGIFQTFNLGVFFSLWKK